MIHRGPAIREFLHRNHRLHLEALPPYAPELNPVEQLLTWLKWSKFANDARDDANSINRSLCPTLRACRHKQNRLASFFGGSALPFPDPSLEI